MSTKPGSSNPICTILGALGGGAAAGALSTGGGPVGLGIVAGAALGHLACKSPPEMKAQPVAVAVPPTPTPPPAELDSDGDGVIDRLDRCPNTPAGTKVDQNGCPEILLTLTGVNFKFDSSQIEPASEQVLAQAVDVLNKASAVNVRIEGHTDSVGSDAYNLKLSDRRAAAVQDYLVKHGIAADRLTTEGKGEGQPVAPNETAAGRYQNRRVEFHVVDSGASVSAMDVTIGVMDPTWRHVDHFVTYY
jgi:OmpA-OmpF porin, OOP family